MTMQEGQEVLFCNTASLECKYCLGLSSANGLVMVTDGVV